MRKITILLSLMTFVSLGFSQELRFGFTVSPTFNFASVEEGSGTDTGTYTDATESKNGIVYGILLDYDFNGDDRYFIHSGLTLHHSGYEAQFTKTGEVATPSGHDINVNYLEIPLALKLKTNNIGYLRYYGQFGLNTGFNVNEKVKNTSTVGGDFDEYSTLNLGLNMGGGIEYNISDETSAVAGLYYNNGFSKAADNSAGTVTQSQLGVRLGVYF